MPKAAPTTKAANLANLCLLVTATAATLWDFRLFDLRIFDGIALASLAAFFLVAPEPLDGFLQRRRDGWLLFATIAVYSALGFALHGHRSSLAILALGVIGFILISRQNWLPATRLFQWLLIAHISFFLIQFFAFYLIKVEIDFQTIIGAQSRITERVYQIRAAGLFQEANSYCLNVFVLGTIVVLHRANWALILATAVTMTISESIWGAGAAFVLLFLDAMNRARSLRQMIKGLVTFGLAIAVIFNAYLWLTKQPHETLPFFYTRVLGVLDDPSTNERYLRNTCSSAAQADIASVPPTTRALHWAFGEGLSTQFFTECLPANGIAFLFKSLGAIGLIALFIGFARALRSRPIREKFYAALAIGFSFTTYPLVTYVIFWIWLPAIIGLLRLRDNAPAPDQDPPAERLVG